MLQLRCRAQYGCRRFPAGAMSSPCDHGRRSDRSRIAFKEIRADRAQVLRGLLLNRDAGSKAGVDTPGSLGGKTDRSTMRNILLVQSNPYLGEILKASFQREGFSAMLLGSVSEIPRSAAETVTDLVVLDETFAMGGIDIFTDIRLATSAPILVLACRGGTAMGGDRGRRACGSIRRSGTSCTEQHARGQGAAASDSLRGRGYFNEPRDAPGDQGSTCHSSGAHRVQTPAALSCRAPETVVPCRDRR